MEPFLQRTQKSTDSGSKWNGSKGYSLNARLIRINFGMVPFGTVPSSSSVNRVLEVKFRVGKPCMSLILANWLNLVWENSLSVAIM